MSSQFCLNGMKILFTGLEISTGPPPPVPTKSAVGHCPTLIQNSKTFRHWKFTQHHRITRPPPSVTELFFHWEIFHLMCWKYQKIHSCYALVNLLIFSSHSMKYIWYSPQKSKYPLYICTKFHENILDGIKVIQQTRFSIENFQRSIIAQKL